MFVQSGQLEVHVLNQSLDVSVGQDVHFNGKFQVFRNSVCVVCYCSFVLLIANEKYIRSTYLVKYFAILMVGSVGESNDFNKDWDLPLPDFDSDEGISL